MPNTGQPSASVPGSGNTVVQIVGNHNNVTIAGAVALRLHDYLSDRYAKAAANPSNQGKPGYTATGRRETRILNPYNRDSLPLQGRADLLNELRAWLIAPAPLSVHVLIGGGGRGKTRLAVELAAEARATGWTAGFASRENLDVFRGAGCRTAWDAPALVIIDYAAAKSTAIATWLRTLVHDADRPGAQPLRLLLLERLGGEAVAWWREVFSGADPHAEAVRDCLAAGAPLTVGPLTDPAERHMVFAAAYRQACDTTPPPPRDAALDDVLARASLGGEPPFLAMFGLIAARQGLAAAQALPADRIALDLADQELLRIGRVWSAHGLVVAKDRPLHAHLAAVAALCEGLSEAAAHAVIARESAALHQAIPPDATEPARAALHAALPGEAGGIAAIQPDILAEAAMIHAWQALPDRGAETVRRTAAAPGQRASAVRSVVRACQDFLIRGEKAPLSWLQSLRADVADIESLAALADAMPPATLELRETASELNETIVEFARGLPDETGAGLLATALNNLSNRLSDLGRREAALQAIEEAVSLRRSLAAARPDAFLPDLARSLNNLSNTLSNLGRREAALQASEEAVSLYRSLAAARPDAFLPDLARSLNNLSNTLSDLGRREAALQASEEAVSLYRSLAAARPDAFLPDLARSLNNLSNTLSDLGRREAALQAIEEAVSLYRSLAAARPDAFLPDLASSLNNLSNRLSHLGRREAALQAIEAAVSLRRSLAAARPDAFLPGLALSLNNLSNRLSNLGRREAALQASEEAASLYRSLAAARPDAFLPDFASSLNNLSTTLSNLGRREAALQASEEAVSLYRSLAAARPDAFLPDLASSLNNLSNRLSDLGRREAALQAIEEAVSLYRSLAAARPDAFLPDLASSLNNLSNRLSDLGRREAALQAIEEAVSLYRSLAAARPDAFLPDLAMSLGARGQSLREAEPEAAAASFAEGIEALRNPFMALPNAFRHRMGPLCRDYLASCEAAGREPDRALLTPIAATFEQLSSEEEPDGSEHSD